MSLVTSLAGGLARAQVAVSEALRFPSIAFLRGAFLRSSVPTLAGVIADETPGRGTNRPPQPGRAYAPDGTAGYVNGPTGIVTTQDFSISMWLYCDLAATRYPFGQGSGFGANNKGVNVVISTSGQISINMNDGNAAPISLTVANAGSFIANAWQLLTITFDRDGSATAYINSTQQLSSPISTRPGDLSGGPWTLGRYGAAALYFPGRISDFRIYGSVLTTAEILELYELGTDALPNKPTLVHYKGDDQHPTVAYDSSGNNRHGTKTSINAAVGQFHYEGADVPLSWQNEKGFSNAAALTNSTLTIANGQNFLSGGVQDFSLCWTQLDASTATYGTILSKGGTTFFEASNYLNNSLRFILRGSTALDTNQAFLFPSSVQNYKTVSIAITVSMSGSTATVKCWMNGVSVGTVTGTWIGPTGTASTLEIGSRSGSQFYEGVLSNIQIYGRALSEAEALAYCNSGAEATGAVHSLPMNEGTGLPLDKVTGLPVVNTAGTLAWSKVPRNEASKANDVLGQPLTYTGECPYPAKLTKSHCLTLDGLLRHGVRNEALITNTTYSLAAWINVPSIVRSDPTVFAVANNRILLLSRSSGTSGFAVAQVVTTSGGFTASTGVVLDFNRDYHLAATCDGSNLRVYLDGELKATTPITGTLAATGPYTTIGASYNDSGVQLTGQYYVGRIWDVRVYAAAKTAAEILAIYNRIEDDVNLAHHYPLAEGAGTILHDRVGGKHMTGQGFNEVAVWQTNTQNVYHRNVAKGFSKRMNYIRCSNDAVTSFGSGGWEVTSGVVLDDDFPDPLGTNQALRIKPGDLTNKHRRLFCGLHTATNATERFVIIYFKPYGIVNVVSYLMSTGGGGSFNVDTETGYKAGSHRFISSEQIGDGWWKIVFGTGAETGTSVFQFAALKRDTANYTYPTDLWTPSSLADEADVVVGMVDNGFEVAPTKVADGNLVAQKLPAIGLVDKTGLPLTHPAGAWHNAAESRIDFTGGVAFPQRLPSPANLVTTAAISSWTSAGSSTVAVSAFEAPNGGVAYAISEPVAAANNFGYYIQNLTTSVAGTAYTMSAYLKAGGRTWATIEGFGLGWATAAGQYINLETGELGTLYGTGILDVQVDSVGDGWYRLAITRTAPASGQIGMWILPASGNNGRTYAGDGRLSIHAALPMMTKHIKATPYKPFGGLSTLDTDWAFNTAHVNPKYHRTLTRNGVVYRADRFLNYDQILLGNRATAAETFTATKEV